VSKQKDHYPACSNGLRSFFFDFAVKLRIIIKYPGADNMLISNMEIQERQKWFFTAKDGFWHLPVTVFRFFIKGYYCDSLFLISFY